MDANLDKRRANARTWYWNHAETERARTRESRAANRAAWFEGRVCANCGVSGELHLDHIDPRQKVTNVIWGWAPKRREIELAKCQTLCVPCHKEKTRQQLPITHGISAAFRHGTPVMYNKHRCRCGLCRMQHRNRGRVKRARIKKTRAESKPAS